MHSCPNVGFWDPMSTLEPVPFHAVPVHKLVPAVLVHTIHGGSRAVLVHCAVILKTDSFVCICGLSG